jgi:xanthine/CO dehydrogenase XdhC/CoxF family maturation factor
VVSLLQERRPTTFVLLKALERAFERRTPLAVATILEGEHIGRRAFAGLEFGPAAPDQAVDTPLRECAERALASRRSAPEIAIGGIEARVWANFRPARPGLWIFGAGDDAQPLLRMAKELGWWVAVADGRSQLATRERFPLADEIHVLWIGGLTEIQPDSQLSGLCSALGDLHPQDAAAIMTHSFSQDARILAALMALEAPPTYIGVLGPQRRTRELLAEATQANDAAVERGLSQLHAPMGLDLGSESPETIAFSVLAEIQKALAASSGLSLREVRGRIQVLG